MYVAFPNHFNFSLDRKASSEDIPPLRNIYMITCIKWGKEE